MKTKYALLLTVLAIAFTLPMFGQDTGMKKHDLSSMIGKPTVDTTFEGLHIKVWLVTQKEHKEMMKEKMEGKDMKEMKHMEMKDTSMAMKEDMKGMKPDSMEMNKAMMDSMMAGTHHIMLDVTDASLGKEIANARTNVLIVSPSKKSSAVDLKPMMSHFGGTLTLDEKGEYRFTVNVIVGGVAKTMQFQYEVE
ncbi:MAG: hypothetical protein ACM34O_14355 [Ignavibacteria bacterium]